MSGGKCCRFQIPTIPKCVIGTSDVVFQLMCAVTVALIVWLWIFHKITQAQLLHHIFYETCVSNLTPKTMDLKFICKKM